MMKGSIFVILGSCSYGVLSTLVVLAYLSGFSLNDVVGSQMVLGAIMLWLYALWHFRRGFGQPSRTSLLKALAAGVTTGTTGLLYYAALQYLSPGFAVVLFFQFTWMGLLLDAVLNKKWPRTGQLLALLPIFAGTILAADLFDDNVALSWPGIGFGLLAALSNTLLIFVSGRVSSDLDPVLRSTLMVTGGAILTSIIVPPSFFINPAQLLPLVSSYGLALAFFGSFFSVLMFAKGAPAISTGLAAIISALQLPMTMVLSVLVLGHSVSLSQLLGIIAILLGVVIAELRPGQSKRPFAENVHEY